jgi:hypothetical protein
VKQAAESERGREGGSESEGGSKRKRGREEGAREREGGKEGESVCESERARERLARSNSKHMRSRSGGRGRGVGFLEGRGGHI